VPPRLIHVEKLPLASERNQCANTSSFSSPSRCSRSHRRRHRSDPTATKKIVIGKRFSGSVASVDRWGNLQVTIVVRKTTTITRTKKVTRRITAVSVPTYPDHTDRSVFINQNALPILKAEALRAQSANINLVSGATDTGYSSRGRSRPRS
jgi:uncharacterized protein with FMN-binding domain